MFIWNYDNVKFNIDKIRKELLDLDARYSTTKAILDQIGVIEASVDNLKKEFNTGIRTKANWAKDENGNEYCSSCQCTKIQVRDNFCANCGADMGKL